MKKFKINLKNMAMFAVCFAICIMTFSGCKKDESNSNDKSSVRKITSFKFTDPPVEGVINEVAPKTITIQVAVGTNITALTPIIIVSEKATVLPASNVPQNFTTPVNYTVTAEDGSQDVYKVTVLFDDERDEWIGSYITTCSYTIDGEVKEFRYILNITKSPNTINGIYLNNFMGKFYKDALGVTDIKVYAVINKNEMTIDFQEQGIKFSGSGNKTSQDMITITNTGTPQMGGSINFTQIAEKQ